jgi:hypothetical protein
MIFLIRNQVQQTSAMKGDDGKPPVMKDAAVREPLARIKGLFPGGTITSIVCVWNN